jgi:type IV secretion system protein VirB10
MYAEADLSGRDPRLALSGDDLRQASLTAAPDVARPARAGDGLGLAVGVLGALGLGAVTLITLSNGRTHASAPPPAAASTPLPQGDPPLPVVAQAPLAVQAAPPPVIARPQPPSPNAVDPNQSRAGPMIIDNTGIEVVSGPAPGPGGAAKAENGPLSQDEQFAVRAGSDAPPIARASSLSDPRTMVVQGTIIPGVLETALNSDLPGYARAIVSRDVRGFDGSKVVIPRGSRLIGQYKSGVATGQSRAFIVWSRLIRPDGVSVQLASPVADASGQSGLSGKVDRHFVQRFGSAMLLSVVSGLASSLGDGSSSTVVIGGSADAQSAAGQALASDSKISPTIRAPQGTPIQVFTARDLDFSGY